MDYISDKVTVLVGEASSRVNETRRKWQQQQQQQQRRDIGTKWGQQETGQDEVQASPPSSAIDNCQQRLRLAGASERAPLAAGLPFGGDTFSHRAGAPPPPPPIGFKTDQLLGSRDEKQDVSALRTATTRQPGQDAAGLPLGRGELADSDQSLYKGDAWARLWFQRVMILCLLRLLLFVRKVYEDFQATKVYNLTGQTGHFLVAATTLFLPTLVFTIYRVSRYLQITLPPLRALREAQRPYPAGEAADERATASGPSNRKPGGGPKSRFEVGRARGHDEAQLSRALMSSPVESTTESIGTSAPVELKEAGGVPASTPADDNEGLVTARQTPTNLEEFHDSTSQQLVEEAAVPRAPSRASRLRTESPLARRAPDSPQPPTPQPPLESVRVDKLFSDATPIDRETTRVVTGAGEQLLHGILFIFWQLKRQVDVMGYLVERACLWRKPAEREKEELGRLRTGSDGLEWFQDFYAAFLAILAQVYTLGLHWSGDESLVKRLSANQVGASTSGLGESGSDLSVSNSARAVSNVLSSQAIAGKALGGKDVLIMSELIVSTAVVLSLLIAVRRRDDGPLTLGLSTLGWGSLFSARIIVIALSFVHLGWHLMLPLVILHVLLITGWIYAIALASHNDSPDERLDEAKWDEETANEVAAPGRLEMGELQNPAHSELEGQQAQQATTNIASQSDQGQLQHEKTTTTSQTSKWSIMEHIVLLAQILTLFSIPSLFYWPIMFNLKLHFRPSKYLVVILLENFLLIAAIWFSISATSAATAGQLYLLGFVGGFSILGFMFISLYIMCKPSLTEYFARADELFNEAEKSGIYYEFCSRVFKMPDFSKQTFRRLMNQSEVVEEVVDEGEDS